MSTTGGHASPAPDDVSDAPGYATHEVLNQAGALVNYNGFAGDIALVEATKAFGAERALRADHTKLRKSCGPSACAP